MSIDTINQLLACALVSAGIALGWLFCSWFNRIQEARHGKSDHRNSRAPSAGAADPAGNDSAVSWEDGDRRSAASARMVAQASALEQ